MHTNDDQKRFNRSRAYLLKETTKGLMLGTTIITAHLNGPVIHNQIKTGKLMSPRSLGVSPVPKVMNMRKLTGDFSLNPKESHDKLKCIQKISLASKKNSRWQLTNGITKSKSKPTQIKNVNQLKACKYLIQLASKLIRPRNSSCDSCDSHSDQTPLAPKLNIGSIAAKIEEISCDGVLNCLRIIENNDIAEIESTHSNYSSSIKLIKCEPKPSKSARRNTVSFKKN